ncbi:MAG: VCBS repeat-containing protein [Bacteroidetes bacterium]|nr:VCBS repeat-containing protein [Bacteroidota bacterium]
MDRPTIRHTRLCLLCMVVIFFAACGRQRKGGLFTQLQPDKSGIHFRNDLNDVDSSTSFINEFGYMGGGVGIGDFNNDGLKDIFFTANQTSCRLYINKGDNKFEDITEQAGLTTSVWATGVSIVDINNDGYDDIYVCVLGKDLLHPAKNLLFVNQHNLTFKEEADDYGLAYSGYSTQAVFLDYDKDGDLDMYLTTYLLGTHTNAIFPRNRSGSSPANDRLYRNDGFSTTKHHPVFTDVTLQAGIKEDGYGLGVTVSDFNNDGWPDIYVANDFVSNDDLWLNCHNGTFTNCISRSLRHQTYSSMGADAADIDNDGLPDIITLDMLPEYNRRRKESFFFMNYDRYQAERDMGYEPEFMRNMLQLNNGTKRSGDTSIPCFSEIGQLSGIEATDWSWSVLIADLDNDGYKDIHITNGIGRDFINADFLEFSSRIFGSNKTRPEQEALIRKRLAELDHVNLSNYLYLNKGNYSFVNASAPAGIDQPSMSNGAAYADLDNDGDLDLVVNNIDKEAFVFINNTVQTNAKNHFLRLNLKGDTGNPKAFGAKVRLYAGGHTQMQEQNPVRGYFSSVDQQLLFGLGNNRTVDSLIITWPDDKQQTLNNIPADTLITLSWQNAAKTPPQTLPDPPPLFTEISSAANLAYRHHENPFNDFALQRLLPHKYSQLGPFITTGDIDNDGRTDFFIGGAFNFSGQLFTQQKDQRFKARNLTDSIKMEEDMACILFDADGDGDSDLLVTGGGYQYEDGSPHYKPRLYINNGKGGFALSNNAIPDSVRTIAGCVAVADMDGDGDPDLFIGGRVSKEYPLPPHSYILRNDKGHFTDVTKAVCPDLERPGMITAAVWTDLNNDKQPDLVLAGEWMPIRFFTNDHGRLHETTAQASPPNMHGMWRSLIAADVDGDGDPDLVAGNLGNNCDYHTTPTTPMELFAADIDANGVIDPVLFYYIMDPDGTRRSYPAYSRSQLAMQVPAVKKRFLLYEDYAKAGFADIFPNKTKTQTTNFYCDETSSCWLENTGNGKFIKHPLPVQAQFAPVNAIICDDLDNDGYKDLLLAGNDYQTDVITGRYDASYGCFLKGGPNKQFTSIPPAATGLLLNGDIKDMALIHQTDGEKIILTAANDDSLRAFRLTPRKK